MKYGILIYFLTLSLSIFANGDSLHYLKPGDTVFLQVNYLGEKTMEHRLEKKQTLYSLAVFYGLKVNDLYGYNPMLAGLQEIPIGYPIQLPIPNRAIIRYLPEGQSGSLYVPILYVVKKGDTLYRIARQYFRMHPAELAQRNQLEGTNLEIGQKLHIGWMDIRGIPAAFRSIDNSPEAERSRELEDRFFKYGQSPIAERGVVYWSKESRRQTDLFALHRTAPINSVIEVRNPLTSRTAFVKVIGRIPRGVHQPEVILVLSPAAASLLGARDNRFFAEIQHY